MIKAPICEVFSSIQGEGKSVGTPSTFVRVWGCNLRCRFDGVHCDTPYAVIKDKEKAKHITPFQLCKEIATYPNKHIIFTGGEPMLYQRFILEVMDRLNRQKKGSYTGEIETNGTVPAIPCFTKHIKQINISVKLKSSNQLDGFDTKRINYTALDTLNLPHKANFKFVISNEEDIEEVFEIAKKYKKLEIYFMPQGVDRETIIKNSRKVVKYCLQYGVRFSPREHIVLWDKKRGV